MHAVEAEESEKEEKKRNRTAGNWPENVPQPRDAEDPALPVRGHRPLEGGCGYTQ
jgi:hypothetical protein